MAVSGAPTGTGAATGAPTGTGAATGTGGTPTGTGGTPTGTGGATTGTGPGKAIGTPAISESGALAGLHAPAAGAAPTGSPDAVWTHA